MKLVFEKSAKMILIILVQIYYVYCDFVFIYLFFTAILLQCTCSYLAIIMLTNS